MGNDSLPSNLPFKRGQHVELIARTEPAAEPDTTPLTARRLLGSEFVGLWQDHTDIGDSLEYARRLREQVQRRDRH